MGCDSHPARINIVTNTAVMNDSRVVIQRNVFLLMVVFFPYHRQPPEQIAG
jgi:hypothetical protein